MRIAYQNRPKLFVRNIVLPTMLYERVIEIDERVGAHGEVVRPLDVAAAERALRAAHADGIRACAIVLMHGYRYTDHERRLAELARAIGFAQVSVSHEVSPLMKLVSRGDTTVVDAYLAAYGEPDPDVRAVRIDAAWADQCRLIDPPAVGEGRAGVSGLADALQGQFPGHAFRRSTAVDAHHDHVYVGSGDPGGRYTSASRVVCPFGTSSAGSVRTARMRGPSRT